LFGGISVTGTIARTATNIRAGARTPLAGIMHSVLLLVFMMVAAPLASYVPLCALAAVLIVVCWNMAERAEFARLLTTWRTAAVLLTTFVLTVVMDLTAGIVAGCLTAVIVGFSQRIAARRH
jgi:SulP family sulfate permease